MSVSETTVEAINHAGSVLIALEEKSLEIEYSTRGGGTMSVDDSRRYFMSSLHQARVEVLANLINKFVSLSEAEKHNRKFLKPTKEQE